MRIDTYTISLILLLSGLMRLIYLMYPADNTLKLVYAEDNNILRELVWISGLLLLSAANSWRIIYNKKPQKLKYILLVQLTSCIVCTYIFLTCVLSKWSTAALAIDTLLICALAWWDFLKYDYSKLLLASRRKSREVACQRVVSTSHKV